MKSILAAVCTGGEGAISPPLLCSSFHVPACSLLARGQSSIRSTAVPRCTTCRAVSLTAANPAKLQRSCLLAASVSVNVHNLSPGYLGRESTPLQNNLGGVGASSSCSVAPSRSPCHRIRFSTSVRVAPGRGFRKRQGRARGVSSINSLHCSF